MEYVEVLEYLKDGKKYSVTIMILVILAIIAKLVHKTIKEYRNKKKIEATVTSETKNINESENEILPDPESLIFITSELKKISGLYKEITTLSNLLPDRNTISPRLN